MNQKLTLLEVFSQPIVPASFFISITSLVGFFYYCIKSGFTKTEKQISWILTFASSLVCSIVSIPYFFTFWRSGWNIHLLEVDTDFHKAMICFFISYLVLDLTLGSIYYRKRITLLTGWIHHPLYIAILFWLMRSRSSSFFSTNGILELPTLLLALGFFKAEWRCDLLFAGSFFILRLVFHACMVAGLKQDHRLTELWQVAVLVYPLHVYWFYGIVTQQIKKYKFEKAKIPNHVSMVKKSKHNFLDRVYTI
ncbi:hypothetical protein K501DRAFT_186663 [Backusella circina FSU 941]|nr:hypothetical protein K501DRAFT_186663 [Backusella circina FSU 941]